MFVAHVSPLEIDTAIVNRFHRAADRGDIRMILEMLRAGVPIDCRDTDGYTALLWAAMLKRTGVVYELLRKGADVNAQSCGGATPLHHVTLRNYTVLMKALLQHGADLSIMDKHGVKPLDLARIGKNEEVIHFLLEQY